MKKVIKGTPEEIVTKIIEWKNNLSEKELPKKYKVEVNDLRGTTFNNYYQILMKFLAQESGEIDFDSLPKSVAEKEFSLYKNRIKKTLGYFIETVSQTPNGEISHKEYISTASMSNKQMLTFIQRVEDLVLEAYPEVDLEKFRKQAELEKK